MNRDLTDDDIDAVLQKQLYGHLGCTLPDGRLYIVPVTYAWHDGAIYSFSYPGQKIDALRKNPSVCFQAEEFVNEGIAKSVIAWGTYEEMAGDERFVAAKIFFRRLEQDQGVPLSPLFQPPPRVLSPAAARALTAEDSIFFRIRIEKKTGKHIQYD